MPEQAAQHKDALAPDDARHRHGDSAEGGDSPAAAAAIPALIRPGQSAAAAGGRVPPATVNSLQRRAGNGATTSAVQRVSVQRDGGYRPPKPPDEQLIKE